MNIAEIVAGIADETAGPSYTVQRLCQGLTDLGNPVALHTLNPLPPQTNYALHGYPPWPFPNSVGFSPAMRAGLAVAASQSEVIHNHGIWLMPNIYASQAAKQYRCKLVVSPHGMLSSWALRHSRLKKKAMWLAAQKWAIEAADCLHATAESEYLEIRNVGLKAPVAIIPNGVDVPPTTRRIALPKRQLLFLARVHEKKGVDMLLRAWARLENEFPDWALCVAGPDNGGYLGKMQSLAKELRVERVTFPGAVIGAGKSDLFFASDLYVLPTHSENFGVTIAEALAHGIPAITTQGAPWQGLQDHGCGWWIDIGVEALYETLRIAMASDTETLLAMGAKGRKWMMEAFSWQSVAEQTLITYQWLVSGETPPAWVRLE